ncbi:MAG TPA: carbohydrate ABC transporter permease [Phycisphaerae bacterium]|nr:carbohydrate ABC transporter permease [Phycisphaerae bacterium]
MNTKNRLFTHALLVIIALFYLGPFLWMLDTSLKTDPQAIQMPKEFSIHDFKALVVPTPWQWQNYPQVIHDPHFDFSLYARNTLIIAVLVALGAMLSSSLVAYSLAKVKWRGRNIVFVIVLASMMLPFPVVMVPLYRIFREFGWIGTNLPLWVPAFTGIPFYIFLLRQFYLTIPTELSEAALIDGCSHFGIWWRIMLPLTRPALAVVGLFSFMAAWNNFLGPLVYLTHQNTFTLALALQNYQSRSGGTSYTLLMAASVLIIAPIIVLFFLAQKTFVRGIATTGIKG